MRRPCTRSIYSSARERDCNIRVYLELSIVPCVTSPSSINTYLVCMGYSSSIVDKAIEECGSHNEEMVEDVNGIAAYDIQF